MHTNGNTGELVFGLSPSLTSTSTSTNVPATPPFQKLRWEQVISKEVPKGNIPAKAWAVLMAFSSFTDSQGFGYPGVEQLRSFVVNDRGDRVSEKTIDRWLAWSVKNGWLRRSQKPAHKSRAQEYWLSWPSSQRDSDPALKRDSTPSQSGTPTVPPRAPEEKQCNVVVGQGEGQSEVLVALEERHGQIGDQAKELIATSLREHHDGTLACIRAAESRAKSNPIGLLVKMLNDGDAKRAPAQVREQPGGANGLTYDEYAAMYERLVSKPTEDEKFEQWAAYELYQLEKEVQRMLEPTPAW